MWNPRPATSAQYQRLRSFSGQEGWANSRSKTRSSAMIWSIGPSARWATVVARRSRRSSTVIGGFERSSSTGSPRPGSPEPRMMRSVSSSRNSVRNAKESPRVMSAAPEVSSFWLEAGMSGVSGLWEARTRSVSGSMTRTETVAPARLVWRIRSWSSSSSGPACAGWVRASVARRAMGDRRRNRGGIRRTPSWRLAERAIGWRDDRATGPSSARGRRVRQRAGGVA